MGKPSKLDTLIYSKGFTKCEIAQKLGIRNNTLIAKLKGENDFKLSEIIKLCEILDLKDSEEIVDVFLKGE